MRFVHKNNLFHVWHGTGYFLYQLKKFFAFLTQESGRLALDVLAMTYICQMEQDNFFVGRY